MILKRLARWIDDRLGTSKFAEESLGKVFPDHWSFMLGEVALYAFVVLVLTGIFLTMWFDPTIGETVYHGNYEPLVGTKVSEAYGSVIEISFDVRAGLVMRQTHHWAANIFVAAIVAHMMRIFFTGAFRRPREINWMIGLTLLLLAIFNGFTGYSLPDDLLSGIGLRIAYSIILSVPVVGTWIAFFLFGTDFPGDEIIGRLYAMHIMIVPALIIGLLSAHLGIIWRQKHTQFPQKGRTESNVVGSKLWPSYATKSIGLFFGVFAVCAGLGGLAQINPIWIYGPFEVQQVTTPAQPDWYVGWLEGALRLFPDWEVRWGSYMIPNPFFPAVLAPGLTFLMFYAWPFLEARFTGDRQPHELLDRPRDHPWRTAIGVGTLTFYLVMFVAGSNDVIAWTLRYPVGHVTFIMQMLIITLPPLAGYVTYRLMNALHETGAERLLEMPKAGWKRAAPAKAGKEGG